MKILHAPWREKYATDEDKSSKKESATKDECVFCKHVSDNKDDEHMVVKRTTNCFVLVNKFPYNAGHILILPNNHKASLSELSQEIQHELIDLTTQATSILKETFQCDGINVGINLGKAAGAGIPSHLHIHILPRWFGDTNFFPTLADTKQISVSLKTVHEKLKEAFLD